MIITEREVKRIVKLHFKHRYQMDVDIEEMEWEFEESAASKIYDLSKLIKGIEIGGVIDEEDD